PAGRPLYRGRGRNAGQAVPAPKRAAPGIRGRKQGRLPARGRRFHGQAERILERRRERLSSRAFPWSGSRKSGLPVASTLPLSNFVRNRDQNVASLVTAKTDTLTDNLRFLRALIARPKNIGAVA